MAKEDIPGIIGGLKNALERGSSLEKAKESFITAGYDAADVEEAANSIGEKKPVKQVVPAQLLAALSKTPEKPLPELPKAGAIKPKKKGGFLKYMIIVIAVIVFLLILNIIRSLLGINF
jgi:hypothetical protein